MIPKTTFSLVPSLLLTAALANLRSAGAGLPADSGRASDSRSSALVPTSSAQATPATLSLAPRVYRPPQPLSSNSPSPQSSPFTPAPAEEPARYLPPLLFTPPTSGLPPGHSFTNTSGSGKGKPNWIPSRGRSRQRARYQASSGTSLQTSDRAQSPPVQWNQISPKVPEGTGLSKPVSRAQGTPRPSVVSDRNHFTGTTSNRWSPPAPAIRPSHDAHQQRRQRIVAREGIVKWAWSIQAPTSYVLYHPQTRRHLDFLSTEKLGIKLSPFKGRKITVTGIELVDIRWPETPILEIESIRLTP